ncbi:hypothetical protein [Mycoplasma phocoenae]|uniref:tRNA pseudouridine synthase B n=1 Tax=Mycoplasma phocoenae TaxID=754517 RepID=A0A858U7G0_9MOLU|nr:hypothetical protein [Mycoplasma phocoenae]QJG66717.1 hypothetical protein HGG69_02555 [Mycoplasma phocoenae]QJG66718.1 hypothetical protein HGG69_02585 [Mycoplasma phocoenae]
MIKTMALLNFFSYVSKGTYIRSILHDLANLLNTDAVMCELFKYNFAKKPKTNN